MNITIFTEVVLRRCFSGQEVSKCDFKDINEAVSFLDKEIRKKEFTEGYIKVLVKKG